MEKLVKRDYWIKKIEDGWRRKNIVWLSGVRRTGKTCLAKTLENTEYFDCELPSVRRMMEDPESFLSEFKGKRIVLDEIHRLGSPAELLKIAADHFKDIQVLATGSSTLGVSRKFKDTLTDRKTEVWLTPLCCADLIDFAQENLKHRLLRGGLPGFFLAKRTPEKEFQEWMDSYWAKDIQEFFRLERRYSFQKFAELLTTRSGGIFEATSFTSDCEVSRTTIMNYLRALEATFVVHVIRPFSTHKTTEIVSAPKVYSFDTGFVCYHKGWHELRREDMGFLWEHFVLNELQAQLQTRDIRYWRDKRGHEIDFVFVKRGKAAIAIECKWNVSEFDPKGIKAFRRAYRKGENFVVANNVGRSYKRNYDDVSITFVSLNDLINRIVT